MADRFRGTVTFSSKALADADVRAEVNEYTNENGAWLDRAIQSGSGLCSGDDMDMEVEDGLVTLGDDSASMGELTAIEAALQASGFAYDGFSESAYEYPAEMRWFRPGMARAIFTILDISGQPAIDMDSVRHAYYAAKENPARAISHLEKLARLYEFERDPISNYA